MKAIVIGAGMGGLCAAIGLKRIGYDIEVYEKVREIRPVGAALSLWSNGVKCLNFLGLEKEVAALGGAMDRMAYCDGLNGEEMTGFSLEPLYRDVGQRAYPVARAELQAMLMRTLDQSEIHIGMKMVSLTQDEDSVTAHFEDGSTATGDLLIGADGAHSIVRPYVLGKDVERRYAGYVNWNGLIEIDPSLAPANQWTTFIGEGKRVSLMPVADNRFYFFFDVPLPAGMENDRARYKDELKAHFSGWAAPVQCLIDRLDPARTNRVEIFDIDPFLQWSRGRVTLLGDSAHNTAPDIGQGGCSAMEDAVALSITLQTNTMGVEDALTRYQDRRASRAGDLVLRARRRSAETHAADPEATGKWYESLRTEDGSRIMRGILSNIEGNPLDF